MRLWIGILAGGLVFGPTFAAASPAGGSASDDAVLVAFGLPKSLKKAAKAAGGSVADDLGGAAWDSQGAPQVEKLLGGAGFGVDEVKAAAGAIKVAVLKKDYLASAKSLLPVFGQSPDKLQSLVGSVTNIAALPGLESFSDPLTSLQGVLVGVGANLYPDRFAALAQGAAPSEAVQALVTKLIAEPDIAALKGAVPAVAAPAIEMAPPITP